MLNEDFSLTAVSIYYNPTKHVWLKSKLIAAKLIVLFG